MDYDRLRAQRFEEYLDRVVNQLRPQAICEECSETQIVGYRAVDEDVYSVAEHVSTRHSIRHVFCDPDQEERDALYAASGTHEVDDEKNGWPIREGEWLRRITPLLPDTRVLFICGANHVTTFRQKLRGKSVDVEVICQDLDI